MEVKRTKPEKICKTYKKPKIYILQKGSYSYSTAKTKYLIR